MIPYLARRIGRGLITIWLAVTLAFFALHLLPGDAVSLQLTDSGASPIQIAAQRAAFGLDQPIGAQYLTLIADLLHGNLGRSLAGSGRAVNTMLAEQAGSTLQLAIAALLIALIVGLGLGMIAALAKLAVVRAAASGAISLTLAAPVYWTGTLAIYFFSVGLRWLPSSGGGDVRHLILPALTLGIGVSGGIAQITAASIRSTQSAVFVRFAHAKGLRSRTIISDHILRTSVTPVITLIGLQAGFLLGGAAITEALFVRPGIGQVVLTAINNHDYPVVQGAVVLSAIAYTVINTIADLINALIDPRLRENPLSGS